MNLSLDRQIGEFNFFVSTIYCEFNILFNC